MNPQALRRYSRHLLVPEIGLRGQERLANTRMLVVGAGGLGAAALQYLAAAGVGRIGVVDDDVVEETNLQRQTIFATADVGRKKAIVAAERLRAINPLVAVDALPVRFDEHNARNLARVYDIVLDCTDRFESRYCINDACVLEKKPDVYGSIFRFDGQVSLFIGGVGPCYRCLYPQPPPRGSVPSCAEGGVLGVLAGIVGTWQANEALKFALGIGELLVGRLLLIDALGAHVREVHFERDPACALCGVTPTIVDVQTIDDDEEELPDGLSEISPERLDETLREAILLDVREPHEMVLGTLDDALMIPASQLEERMHELDSAQWYVVACRVGVKSAWAAGRLRDAGFKRLHHLRGGLLAYAASHERFEAF